MTIERGNLRPPSEAESLMIRVVRNCPWNKCKFCPAYKGEAFSIRSAAEVIAEIEHLAADPENHRYTGVFLQDGDALAMPFESLLAVINAIRQHLPAVERITAYSRSNLLNSRKVADLQRLRAAGLDRIHVGMESGCDEVLAFMNKGTTFEKQKTGCLRAKEAGFEICCYFMPGLGGREWSEKHALDSGRLIREIEPNHLRLRTCFVLEDTPLADEYRAGHFTPLTELETVRELRLFLSCLADAHTELVSDHRINLLMELHGRLPEDYAKLIGIIDRYLALSSEDQALFEAGRRLELVRRLDQMDEPGMRDQLRAQQYQYQRVTPVPKSVLYPKRTA